ncbi:Uncharacterised protein g10624 [Pycnogonum litorale]
MFCDVITFVGYISVNNCVCNHFISSYILVNMNSKMSEHEIFKNCAFVKKLENSMYAFIERPSSKNFTATLAIRRCILINGELKISKPGMYLSLSCLVKVRDLRRSIEICHEAGRKACFEINKNIQIYVNLAGIGFVCERAATEIGLSIEDFTSILCDFDVIQNMLFELNEEYNDGMATCSKKTTKRNVKSSDLQ